MEIIGKTINHYRIIERLGEGGMGVVYKAYDSRLECEVAVKLLRKESIPQDQHSKLLKRFEREAKAQESLDHPNIIPVYDFGQYEGDHYLVMRFIPGETLTNHTRGKTPWREAARLLAPVANGLAYAHARGVLHRDVKPSNILIDDDGTPILADFGIAKLVDTDETTLTATGIFIGTPEYMAPEQWKGNPVPQTDIYALGVILYELITGQKPYTAETPMGIALKQLTEPLPSPVEMIPDLPVEVERVILKALEVNPEDRYSTMSEFARVLVELKDADLTMRFPASESDGDETKVGLELIREEPKKSWALPSWMFGIGGLILLGVVALVVVGGYWLLNGGSDVAENPNDTALVITTTEPSFPAPNTPTASISPSPTYTIAPTLTSTLIPVEYNPKDNAPMVFIPSGEFIMGVDHNGLPPEEHDNYSGPEYPEKTVYVDAYHIYQMEVTTTMYLMCVEDNFCDRPQNSGSYLSDNYFGNERYADYPMVNVSWRQAQTYCNWAGGRLPYEAEWEKAARGESGNKFPWGNQDPNGSQVNLCDKNCTYHNNSLYIDESINDGYDGMAPVGSYPEGMSPFFVLDMSGNVWEWVWDWFQVSYANLPLDNPHGPANGSRKVIRGGSYINNIKDVRALTRESWDAENATTVIGFRCIVEISQ